MKHKGFLWGEVTSVGRSAHGSRWDLGDSASHTMGKIIVALDDLDRSMLRERTEDLLGPASMHVSLINGGVGVSTYAPECKIHLERRTLPSENMDEVKRELERAIHQIAEHAQIDWYFSRPPFSCDPKESVVQHLLQAYETTLHRRPELVGWGVWTDAAIFRAAGIPTVNMGPAGFGLHEEVEWVDFDSVIQNTLILINAANTFLQERE